MQWKQWQNRPGPSCSCASSCTETKSSAIDKLSPLHLQNLQIALRLLPPFPSGEYIKKTQDMVKPLKYYPKQITRDKHVDNSQHTSKTSSCTNIYSTNTLNQRKYIHPFHSYPLTTHESEWHLWELLYFVSNWISFRITLHQNLLAEFEI